MSRALWFVAGAGASVYAMNKARRLRDSFTVDGLRDRASSLALGARLIRDEVAQGKADKETELRQRLGLVPDGTPQLESAAAGRHRLDAGAAPPRSTPTHHVNTDVSGTNQEGTN
ncbi:DUF6167 family protein [Nocardioides jensenii]|uniref:DUF6167 family protein n=1 Tax=Nocardioides jensenii TaxID=1843 RepID=UPI0008341F5C|nr:DUF6167 family protein [Nocardioides jensenii]